MKPYKDSHVFTIVTVTIVAYFLHESYCQVECQASSGPVVFGQSLDIQCRQLNKSVCVYNNTRTWSGGKGNRLLVMDGIPTDTTGKYTEHIPSCTEFSLRISNVTEKDLNYPYCCVSRFDECRVTPTFENVRFQYLPDTHNIAKNISLTSANLSISISIKMVYPKPTCTVIYEEKKLDQISYPKVDPIGNFFNWRFNLNYTFPEEKCPVAINISCMVGSSKIIEERDEFSNCSVTEANEKTGWFVLLHILAIFVPLLCLVIVICGVFRNWRKICSAISDLSNRHLSELRRPIIGFVLFVALLVLILMVEITSFSHVHHLNDHAGFTSALVGCTVLTPVALCFISNPETISIREGFKNAWKRFIQKIKLKRENEISSSSDFSSSEKQETETEEEQKQPML